MTFITLAQGDAVFDNREGLSPLQWNKFIDTVLQVPEGSWLSTGQLQLQLQVQFGVSINENFQKAGTERFHNPTQLQIGHWSTSAGGYTLSDGRLKYVKQAINIKAPIIEISNTRIDARINMGLTTKSGSGHAQNIAPITVCGTARGYSPPPPTQTELDVSQQIPKGAICLKTAHGRMDFQESEPFTSLPKTININTIDFSFPDELSGVLWTGYQLGVSYKIGYTEYVSTAVPYPAATYVRGDVQPALYEYTCELGVSVPVVGACDPNSVISIVYGQYDGIGRLTCGTTYE